jgi:hypothetical protein
MRISERRPFLFTCPEMRSNESEGMPYIKTGALRCLMELVSDSAEKVSVLVFSELLQETKRTKSKIYFEIFGKCEFIF